MLYVLGPRVRIAVRARKPHVVVVAAMDRVLSVAVVERIITCIAIDVVVSCPANEQFGVVRGVPAAPTFQDASTPIREDGVNSLLPMEPLGCRHTVKSRQRVISVSSPHAIGTRRVLNEVRARPRAHSIFPTTRENPIVASQGDDDIDGGAPEQHVVVGSAHKRCIHPTAGQGRCRCRAGVTPDDKNRHRDCGHA